jgi:hypothetical protein
VLGIVAGWRQSQNGLPVFQPEYRRSQHRDAVANKALFADASEVDLSLTLFPAKMPLLYSPCHFERLAEPQFHAKFGKA